MSRREDMNKLAMLMVMSAWESSGRVPTELTVKIEESGHIVVGITGNTVMFPFLLGNLILRCAEDAETDVEDLSYLAAEFAQRLSEMDITVETISEDDCKLEIKFNDDEELKPF